MGEKYRLGGGEWVEEGTQAHRIQRKERKEGVGKRRKVRDESLE